MAKFYKEKKKMNESEFVGEHCEDLTFELYVSDIRNSGCNLRNMNDLRDKFEAAGIQVTGEYSGNDIIMKVTADSPEQCSTVHDILSKCGCDPEYVEFIMNNPLQHEDSWTKNSSNSDLLGQYFVPVYYKTHDSQVERDILEGLRSHRDVRFAKYTCDTGLVMWGIVTPDTIIARRVSLKAGKKDDNFGRITKKQLNDIEIVAFSDIEFNDLEESFENVKSSKTRKAILESLKKDGCGCGRTRRLNESANSLVDLFMKALLNYGEAVYNYESRIGELSDTDDMSILDLFFPTNTLETIILGQSEYVGFYPNISHSITDRSVCIDWGMEGIDIPAIGDSFALIVDGANEEYCITSKEELEDFVNNEDPKYVTTIINRMNNIARVLRTSDPKKVYINNGGDANELLESSNVKSSKTRKAILESLKKDGCGCGRTRRLNESANSLYSIFMKSYSNYVLAINEFVGKIEELTGREFDSADYSFFPVNTIEPYYYYEYDGFTVNEYDFLNAYSTESGIEIPGLDYTVAMEVTVDYGKTYDNILKPEEFDDALNAIGRSTIEAAIKKMNNIARILNSSEPNPDDDLLGESAKPEVKSPFGSVKVNGKKLSDCGKGELRQMLREAKKELSELKKEQKALGESAKKRDKNKIAKKIEKAEKLVEILEEEIKFNPKKAGAVNEAKTLWKEFTKWSKLYEAEEGEESEDDKESDEKPEEGSKGEKDEKEEAELEAILLTVKNIDKVNQNLIDAGIAEDHIQLIPDEEDPKQGKIRVDAEDALILKEYLASLGIDLEEEIGAELISDEDPDEKKEDSEKDEDDKEGEEITAEDIFGDM